MTRCAVMAVLLSVLVPGAPLQAAQTVIDDLGHSVSLAAPAQRIVTLAPHVTELVVAAGATRQLVGIAAGGPLPQGVVALPRVGGPGPIDREALLRLRPDLVIGWQTGNRATDLDWIARAGIALYRSEPATLGDIAATIRDIGTLSGTAGTAEAAAGIFETGLVTRCAPLPARAAYIEVWARPAMTVGARHWINAVLDSAGYRNLYGDLDRGVFAIAPEAAFAARTATRISLVRRHDGSEADRLADLLSRPGPRLAEAVRMLCVQRLDPGSATR